MLSAQSFLALLQSFLMKRRRSGIIHPRGLEDYNVDR